MTEPRWTIEVPVDWRQERRPPAELIAMAPMKPRAFIPNLNVVFALYHDAPDYLVVRAEELQVGLTDTFIVDAKRRSSRPAIFDLAFAHISNGWRVTSLQRHLLADGYAVIATATCATADLPAWFRVLEPSVHSIQLVP